MPYIQRCRAARDPGERQGLVRAAAGQPGATDTAKLPRFLHAAGHGGSSTERAGGGHGPGSPTGCWAGVWLIGHRLENGQRVGRAETWSCHAPAHGRLERGRPEVVVLLLHHLPFMPAPWPLSAAGGRGSAPTRRMALTATW